MTGAMHVVADVIPSAVPAIVDPWLGLSGLGTQLAVLAGWTAVALGATAWVSRRTASGDWRRAETGRRQSGGGCGEPPPLAGTRGASRLCE
jgi:hypothetical protein